MNKAVNITFYKNNNKIYFNYLDKEYECNFREIYNLKETITYPTILTFESINENLRTGITNMLTTDMINITNQKQENNYIVLLSKREKQNEIYGYKLTNKQEIVRRTSNIYKLLIQNKKRILLEVDKQLIKNEPGEYYLIKNDMTKEEQTIYEDYMYPLDIDYVYNINNNIMDKIYGEPKKLKKTYKQ